MRRSWVLLLLSLTVIVALAAGCGAASTNTTGTTQPTATTEAASSPETTATTATEATGKSINLRWSDNLPPMSPDALLKDEYCQMVGERTNGRVTITNYHGDTLYGGTDHLAAVQTHVADIVTDSIGFRPESWPLNMVFNLPGIGAMATEEFFDYRAEMEALFPELMAEFDALGVRVIRFQPGSDSILHTTKKQVRVPDDIVGLKVISFGGITAFLEQTGASPVNLTLTDFYSGLERGVAEGLMIPYQVMDVFGCTELMKYHVDLDLLIGQTVEYINKEVWDKIAPEDQKIFDEIMAEMALEMIQSFNAGDAATLQKCKDAGHTVIMLTPEEIALWSDKGQSMREDWVKMCEAQGKANARAILEAAVEIAQKYR